MHLSSPTIKKLQIVICTLLLLLSCFQVLWTAIKTDGFYDLPAYVGAASQLLQGNSPYAQEYANGVATVNFQYPPAAALWLTPIFLFASPPNAALFSLFSLTAFIGALWQSYALLESDDQPPAWHKLLVIALLVQTFPLKLTIMLGQINTFVLLLMIASLYLLKRKKLLASAILLSGAISIKIIPIVFVLLAQLRREFKWSMFVMLSLLCTSLLVLPLSIYFFTQILPGLLGGTPAVTDPLNQSLVVLLHRLQLGQISGVVVLIIEIVLGVLIYRKTKAKPLWMQMVALLPILVLVAANAWQHHLIVMYPFLIIFVRKWRWFLPMWLLLAIRPSYILLIQPTPSWLWSYQTIGIVVMVVIFLSLKHEKTTKATAVVE